MASKNFARACQLGVVFAFGATLKYKYTYESVPTDSLSTKNALMSFLSNRRQPEFYDVAIVGGGIVGIATAREIRKKFPNKRVVLLEKEADVAQHQSGHNSGVIHAGMYYTPGSLMARLCPRGHDLMIEYCTRNKLPYERVGKIIVAVNDKEVPTIEKLYEQGVTNGVRNLRVLRGQEEISKVEPNVRGVCALYSPDTGIADFGAVTRCMLKELEANARGFFKAQFQFEALDFVGFSFDKLSSQEMVLIRGRETGQLGPEKTFTAKNVITCCGLSNDLIAHRSGSILGRVGKKVIQTFSFRGRYYQLKPEARDLVSMNVYPSPNASKGLSVGIHFTPTVNELRGSQVIIGPGSVMATHRYGYSPYSFDIEYCMNSVISKGGWVSLIANIGVVFNTFYVDVNRKAFLEEARKLIPTLKDSDIEESFCGVMGVAVNESGSLELDLSMELARPRTVFTAAEDISKTIKLKETDENSVANPTSSVPLILNVRNAPSPAATSSMAIAEEIVAAAKENFKW